MPVGRVRNQVALGLRTFVGGWRCDRKAEVGCAVSASVSVSLSAPLRRRECTQHRLVTGVR